MTKTPSKPSKSGPVKTYCLPIDEVHKRYGLPGECKGDHAVIPDIDGLAQRRAARKVENERVPTEEE